MKRHKDTRRGALIKELKMGEESGFVENFDKDELLKRLHKKINS
ncbi:MAG: type II toxin-antitoxin system ParD family antitoxin [Bacteroidales bacterium]